MITCPLHNNISIQKFRVELVLSFLVETIDYPRSDDFSVFLSNLGTSEGLRLYKLCSWVLV
jgi:hypothetical protein